MLSSFKAVFFDAGGTLLHPYPSVGAIYEQISGKHGSKRKADVLEMNFRSAWLKRDGLSSLQSHSSEKIEREWWKSLVFEVFGTDKDIHDFEKFFDELYDYFAKPECWQLYPGTKDVLKALKHKGKKLGVISNWDSRLFKILDGLGLTGEFEFILASAVFGASKPSPKIFQEALKKSGVHPHEAVHIGDSVEDDIHGAMRLGIHAILVDRHKGHRDGPVQDIPVIHSLSELL